MEVQNERKECVGVQAAAEEVTYNVQLSTRNDQRREPTFALNVVSCTLYVAYVTSSSGMTKALMPSCALD